MPIYEYRCLDCGKVTELLVRSAGAEPNTACGHCNGRNLIKLISTPAAVRMGTSSLKGKTCCGQDERCDVSPCSSGGTCRRD